MEPQQIASSPSRTGTRDRGAVIGDGVVWLGRWSLQILLIAAGATLVAWVLAKLWVGVFPIVLALIVSTVLWPGVAWLRGRRVPSALAAVLVMVGGLLLFVGVLAAIAPSLVDQSRDLADSAAKGLTTVQDRLAKAPFNLDSKTVEEGVSTATAWLQDRGGQIASGAIAGASAVGNGLVTLVLVLILVFFFLKDGPNFLPFVRRVSGERAGAHLTEVLTRSWNTLGGFVRTQALVSFVDAVGIGLGLFFLQVPLAFALAVLTFFGGFIPIVGAFAVGLLAVLVALVAQGPTTALFVLILIVAVQQIEGNVLQPFLQGRSMQLHAGIILLSVAVGSTIFGIVGAFLAVPAAAVTAVVLRYISEQVNLRAGDVRVDQVQADTAEGRRMAEHAQAMAHSEQSRASRTPDSDPESEQRPSSPGLFARFFGNRE